MVGGQSHVNKDVPPYVTLDGDYASFVARAQPSVAHGGAIVDEGGTVLGTHGGVHRFTVGQRKGLGGGRGRRRGDRGG